jgi:hypothetical protein
VKRLAILLSAVMAVGVGASVARADTHRQEMAQAQGVVAYLDYDRHSDFEYRNVTLTVSRQGTTALDHVAVAPPCHECPVYPAGPIPPGRSITVRDLDGDGEPEVLVDLYTGGAHCCYSTWFYRWDATASAYAKRPYAWGDPSYRIGDLRHDGRPELITADDRFAYAFSCFACSYLPTRIFSYEAGHLRDVTRRFPSRLHREAREVRRLYERERKRKDGDVRGILPAYLADEYRLGHGGRGERLLRKALRRGDLDRSLGFGSTGRAYVRKLHAFLRRTGYIR